MGYKNRKFNIIVILFIALSGCVSKNTNLGQQDFKRTTLPVYPITKRGLASSPDATDSDDAPIYQSEMPTQRFVRMEVTTQIPDGSQASMDPTITSPACDARLTDFHTGAGELSLSTTLPFRNLDIPTHVNFGTYLTTPLSTFEGRFPNGSDSPGVREQYWGYNADTETYYEVRVFENGMALQTQFEIDMNSRILREARIRVLAGPANKPINDRALVAQMICTPIFM